MFRRNGYKVTDFSVLKYALRKIFYTPFAFVCDKKVVTLCINGLKKYLNEPHNNLKTLRPRYLTVISIC